MNFGKKMKSKKFGKPIIDENERIMSIALGSLDSKPSLENLEDLENLDADTIESLESLADETNEKVAGAVAKVIQAHTKNQHNCGKKLTQLKSASITLKYTRTITRGNAPLTDGSGQPIALPAPTLGVLEFESNYSRVLAAFLPKDGSVVVVSVARTADGQSVLITLRDRADTITETVLITGTNTVYTNLIRGLSSYQFDIVRPKMIIGDVLRTNQFDQPVNIFIGSMFTSANQDNISPQDYKSDVLSDNTVRILGDTVCINPEKTLVPMLVAPTGTANGSSFYFTLTCPLKNFTQA